MRLYNTPKKQIEDIKPLNPPSVGVYTCGPTVYDYPHIGNWFTFIRYDILVRALKYAGLKPSWVMNITDVGHLVSDADEGEDKLETGARREGKSAWDVAKFYSDYFIAGLQRLNITTANHLPKATDHVKEQIELIQKLEAKGYTYAISDGVYYDTSRFQRYAEFAHLDLREQEAGKRFQSNPEKRSPSDFALWRFSPKDHKRDMEWDSPWGKGFPGWHIECSAMSMKYLGETLDIHGGGLDHIPVHHTNEIAQSEAATDKHFVNYWFHSNFILVNGKKMAKSAGNYYTLEDIENRNLHLEAFRLLVLESHYRTEAEFSWGVLNAAQVRLRTYQALADLRFQPVNPNEQQQPARLDYDEYLKDIKMQLLNDLNTPRVLSILDLVANKCSNRILKEDLPKFTAFLKDVDKILGLRLLDSPDITQTQKSMIAEREQARKALDWDGADKTRERLKKENIGVRDTKYGSIWYRL